jgi:signal transduction histidine kinase
MTTSFKNDDEITEIIRGSETILDKNTQDLKTINTKLDICSDHLSVYGYAMFDPVWKGLYNTYARGVTIRLLTEITKDNIDHCKKLCSIAEVRHIDNIKGNFGIGDESDYRATPKIDSINFAPKELIKSTVKTFVEQQQLFFDMLWEKSISAEQRIKEIEYGIKREFIETINDSVKVKTIALDLLSNAKKEILIIFSDSHLINIEANRELIEILQKKQEDKNVTIKMIFSSDTKTEILDLINVKGKSKDKRGWSQSTTGLEFQKMQPKMNTGVSIFVIDGEYSLSIESNPKSSLGEFNLFGLSSYSNSQSTVMSYISIFQLIWMQNSLHLQLRQANKKLKLYNKIQKEFIDTAAHELRSPITPIISLASMLSPNREVQNQEEYNSLVEIIVRNAERLNSLAKDLLDVTKIESHSMNLKSEVFDIVNLVKDIIEGHTTSLKFDTIKNIQIVFTSNGLEKLNVKGDRTRIIQVFENLLDNAIRFSDEFIQTRQEILRREKSMIQIIIDKSTTHDNSSAHLLTCIKDNGPGIDSATMPKLFKKFTTQDPNGNGLGLYISKGIVEAHGGKIWAKNNPNKDGASFFFTLPMYIK